MTRSSDKPFIQIQNVSKHFGQFCALNSVSLDIELGQKLVICGPSGSGKSTLIRCINRLEIHEKGKIFIDGKIVDGSPKGQDVLRNNVGMVFQQFNLFPHLTILENLMLGPLRARHLPESEARDLAMQYLERVRIPEQLDKYPAQLSGGQQQRVAIARAFVNRPRIILADEPTGNLDSNTGQEIINYMKDLQKEMGTTIITVTHDDKMLTAADRMAWIRDGLLDRVANREEIDIQVGSIREN